MYNRLGSMTAITGSYRQRQHPKQSHYLNSSTSATVIVSTKGETYPQRTQISTVKTPTRQKVPTLNSSYPPPPPPQPPPGVAHL